MAKGSEPSENAGTGCAEGRTFETFGMEASLEVAVDLFGGFLRRSSSDNDNTHCRHSLPDVRRICQRNAAGRPLG